MSNINVNIDTAKEEKRISDVPALCRKAELTISNQAEYESASNILKEIKSRYKELDTQRKEITTPLDAAKKSIMDLFKSPLTLLEQAEKKVKNLMIGFTNEQGRLAKEEQKRLQKIADDEAAHQKKLLDAKIARAKASGKEDKVEVLEMEKETIAPIVAPVISPKINTPAGVSYRDNWTAEITDVNLVPREYMTVNIQALNAVAKSTKGTLTIPGVKFKCEKILASR
jgi:uncharacterized protein YdiU (UPF0061 family)